MMRRTARLWVGDSVQGEVESVQDATVESDNPAKQKATRKEINANKMEGKKVKQNPGHRHPKHHDGGGR